MRGPRFAAVLLRGFIADPDLEEAILGDLAEEWSERAGDAGVARAHAWYWRQVARSVPHLLRHWWLRQSPAQAARTLGRVGVALLVATALAAATTVGMLIVAGGAPGGPGPDITRAIVLAGSGWAGVAGFVLASRTADAPMASAVLLGLCWVPTTFLAASMHPTPGPPDGFFAAYPTLLPALTVAGGALATLLRAGRRKDGPVPGSDPSTLEEAMTEDSSAPRLAVRPLLAAAFILMVPLVAMQLTDEVVWTLSDFVIMGVLVSATGVLFELALRKADSTAYRAAAGVALGTAFLLVWTNLAVGVIGASGNAANLMYAGVLAVGIGGTVGAGLEPRGMARALVATAVAQALVAVIAVLAGAGLPASPPMEVLAINGFFAALWIGSAWLFRRAARERIRGRSAPATRSASP